MSNFNFNKVILGGRLTAVPELKQTPSGIKVCSFSIAVNRNRSKDSESQQADFINCVAWRETADFICRYFGKGSAICVVGELQTRSWEKDGERRYATEVTVSEASFVDSKGDDQRTSLLVDKPKFETLDQDEDLPF